MKENPYRGIGKVLHQPFPESRYPFPMAGGTESAEKRIILSVREELEVV